MTQRENRNYDETGAGGEKDSSQENSFWDSYEPPSNFLTREQREAIVKRRTPVKIVGVKESTGRFGDVWQFTLQIAGFESEMLISLAKNDLRDDFARAVKARTDNNGSVHAIITTIKTGSGQTAYIFDDPNNPRGQSELAFGEFDNYGDDTEPF